MTETCFSDKKRWVKVKGNERLGGLRTGKPLLFVWTSKGLSRSSSGGLRKRF